MRVKDLVNKLNELNQDLEIYCYCEDSSASVLDIINVSSENVEKFRLDDDTPVMSFKKSPRSQTVAILEISADF